MARLQNSVRIRPLHTDHLANGTLADTYVYDHAGNRVKQSDGTNTLIYPNSYYTIDGSNVERHILAGSLGSLATSTWDGTAATVVYHHDDHLGGTHVETDGTGAAIEYILYKPFGGTLVDHKTGTYDNNFKYTGKEKDEDTGWYYYGARYYNADTGQFLSEDPVFLAMASNQQTQSALKDPQLLNSYAYARNNPVLRIDPNGEWPTLAGLAKGFDTAFNFITLGAGDKAAEMGHNGLTAGGVAQVAGGVAFGTITTSLAALDVGAAAGGLAVDIGLATSRQQVTSRYNWGSPNTLERHFEDHGNEVGAQSASDYASKANQFYQRRMNYDVKKDSAGTLRVFDQKTGEFGAYNANGSTRTYFKPSSPTYFDRQPGTVINKQQE